MQFLLLVYADEDLLGQLPPPVHDAEMKQCLEHADEMQASGCLLESRQLEAPATARRISTTASMSVLRSNGVSDRLN